MAVSAITTGHDERTILEYLASLLYIAFGVSRTELETNGSLLSAGEVENTIRRCKCFLEEQQTALYVHKYAGTSYDR